MVSGRIVLIAAASALSFIFTSCDDSFDNRSLESVIKTQEENNLCDAGEQCAVRKGARVGKLCGCPQGTSCHFFILKCL
ncbi:Cocaine- and amphetamine-regulated transcript protein [Anabarilius grahami]|uniref:Cocaine-and amphetamine-regulated transcript protein n=1 Tax=Anabarilius grahami TaxID=495550 RepID=A0A3N0Z9Y6_ANAGA|nr:Cocaine- and amphetamine-regulated transcript protein [Anabarilius grahami]